MEPIQVILILLRVLSWLMGIMMVIFIVLTLMIERRIRQLNEIYFLKANSKKRLLKEGIDGLIHEGAPPSAVLDFVDSSARDFLEERFGIERYLDYSEMVHMFAKLQKKKLVLFSVKMIEAKYSGKDLEIKDVNTLAEILESVFTDYEKATVREINEMIKNIPLGSIFIPIILRVRYLESTIIKFFAELAEKLKKPKKKDERKIIEREGKAIHDEVHFEPEKIKIKDFKMPSQEILGSRFVESLDSMDRIQERIRKIKKERRLDLPESML